MGLTGERGVAVAADLAALDDLRLLPLAVTMRALDAVELPSFAGSTLRGAFGHALKDAVCVVSHRDCGACRLRDACSFPYVFETPRDAGARRLRGASNAPHPYRVDAAGASPSIAPGDELRFGLTLIGRAVELLPAVASALCRMGDRGLSSNRSRLALAQIDAMGEGDTRTPLVAGNPPAFRTGSPPMRSVAARARRFAESSRVEVRFPTPVRFTWGGRPARDVSFPLLIRNLLRRASSLLEFHEGVDLDIDYREWIARAERVACERADLVREDRLRYSARQERTMNMHGLTGEVTFAGDIGPFAPLLALGEAVGVGKGTTFGLGAMHVVDRPERS